MVQIAPFAISVRRGSPRLTLSYIALSVGFTHPAPMRLQNRVLPTGDIVAHPARGLFMGNRGILHDDHQTLGPARWRHYNWIICMLAFKGRKRSLMAPGGYTELFFLDEAVAFAAGHRPCAECRRAAYNAFTSAWARAFGDRPGAKDIDRTLHAARVTRTRQQVRHTAPCASLPDGAFILHNDQPHLVLGRCLHPWTPAAYMAPVPRPETAVAVLTPRPLIEVLGQGYAPTLHPSALT
jgi:hypothetical protein